MSTRLKFRRGHVVLLLVLLAQVACVPLATQKPAPITVPPTLGVGADVAQRQLTSLGFVVDQRNVTDAGLSERFGDDRSLWPANQTVFDVQPDDAQLLPGSRITLLVAKPTRVATSEVFIVTVPELRGGGLVDAVRALDEHGLPRETVVLDAVALRARFGAAAGRWPPGETVISQSPVAGSEVDKREAVVRLEVARWTLADGVSRSLLGQSGAAATRQLEANGFVVQTRSVSPTDAPDARRGDVLSAQLATSDDGRNVVMLSVASRDGANVTPPPRDSDRDGVLDAQDRCPNTPRGQPVDGSGCVRQITPPIDTDTDGVIDSADACPGTPAGVTVDARGCTLTVAPPDTDGDGVPDAQDLCPDTPRGSLNAPQGCTLTQRVSRLPEAQYAYNRQSVMEVGRDEGYKVVLVLDPRGGATPSDVEARILSELPSSDRPPVRDVQVETSAGADCAPPVVCFREKYYESMRVDLRVDQDGWTIRPDNPVAVRGVVSNEVTRWGWTVIPACDGGGLLDGECRQAELTLDAYAMFDQTSYGPIMVFSDKISVQVAAQERVASFFERHRDLLLGALVFPILIALATWWLSRRRAPPGAVDEPEFEAVSLLFIGANPRSTGRIRLDEEVRAIDQSIRLGERRDAFTLHQHWAARVSDLDDALMRYRPNIVHISAHGTDGGELLLEGGDGDDGKVSARQLEKLFAILSDDIRLIVLNACFSEEQARLLVNHVDCVVGMSDAVNDKVAQRFAAAFYHALANGRSVQTAFDLASEAAKGKHRDAVPRLLALRGDPNRVAFARRAPTRHIEGVTR